MVAYCYAHSTEIVLILLIISEILGSIPSLKVNSLCQAIVLVIQIIVRKFLEKPLGGSRMAFASSVNLSGPTGAAGPVTVQTTIVETSGINSAPLTMSLPVANISNSVQEHRPINLVAGDNIVAGPTGAVGFTIIPPAPAGTGTNPVMKLGPTGGGPYFTVNSQGVPIGPIFTPSAGPIGFVLNMASSLANVMILFH